MVGSLEDQRSLMFFECVTVNRNTTELSTVLKLLLILYLTLFSKGWILMLLRGIVDYLKSSKSILKSSAVLQTMITQ